MSRAQEIRAKILAANEVNISEKVDEVFNWILDLLDSDDSKKKKYFKDGIVNIWYLTDERSPLIYSQAENFHSDTDLSHSQKAVIFESVKNLFEKEEGFAAKIIPNMTYEDRPSTTLQISIH